MVVAMAPVPLGEIDAGIPLPGAHQPQAPSERRALLFRFLWTNQRRQQYQQQQQERTALLDGKEEGR